MPHALQIMLDDSLINERDDLELRRSMTQGLILLDYLSAKISIGKFAELMEMGYQEATQWLHRRGVATLRKFTDPELEAACKANHEGLADDLGIAQSDD